MSHSHDRVENPYEAPRMLHDASATPGGDAPTRVRYIVMAFLGVLAFLTYFDRICITRAAAVISKDLSLTDVQMGWIMGAFWFAYAVFELPAGRMGDRHGARITLSRIVLAWSVFTALSGCSIGFVSLLMYRFLFGVGEAGAFPNMARIQSRWLPVAKRPVFGGLLWMLARWGGAFSIPFFGLMMRTFDSETFDNLVAGIPLVNQLSGVAAWRLSFMAAGMIGLVWIAAFYWWFRDHPSEKSTVNEAELKLITHGAPPEVRGHAMEPGMWTRLLTNRSLLSLGVLYLCGSFGWSFFASWMPKYFKDVQKMPYEESEWMSAAPLFFGGITCLLGGFLCNWMVKLTGSQRWGRAVLPVGGYITAAIAMFCIPFVRSPTEAIVLMCIAEAAHDLGQGSNWASIMDIGGKYAGVAAGLINTIGNMGNAFQPAIGAMIRERYGWNAMFVVYSVAFLIAASMWLWIDPRRTFYENGDRAAE